MPKVKWRTWGNVKWLLAEVYDQPWLPGLKAKPREDQAHGRKWPPALERCLHFSVRTVHAYRAQEHNSGQVSTLFRMHCAPAHLPSWAETLLNVTVHNQVSINLSIQVHWFHLFEISKIILDVPWVSLELEYENEIMSLWTTVTVGPFMETLVASQNNF